MSKILERTPCLGISADDFSFLNNELEKTWNLNKIPSYHREIFSNYLDLLPAGLVPLFIAQEIDKIETGKSPLVIALDQINEREHLIGKLKNIHSKSIKLKSKDFNITELECANLIKRLREATIKVIESILAWKKIFRGVDCQFYWNQICYIEKIKHDLDFLTNIGGFGFMNRDPFFSNMGTTLISQKARNMLKMTLKMQKKVKKLEKSLNYGMNALPVFELSSAKNTTLAESDHIFALKVPTRKEFQQIEQNNLILSFDLYEDFVLLVLSEVSQSCIDNEYDQLNIIQISQELSGLYINEIALEESELIFFLFLLGYSEEIMSKYCEELVQKELEKCILWKEILIRSVAGTVLESLNFVGIVITSISEFREENEALADPCFEFIFSELFRENWVSSLIEETLQEPAGENLSVEELIYFSLLHEYAGGIWVKSLVQSSFKEIQGKDERTLKKLMPIIII